MISSFTSQKLDRVKPIEQGRTDIFLVASPTDEKIRDEIHESLMREGFTLWQKPDDAPEISPSNNSLQGIKQAGVIVYLVSTSSEQSQMCQEELAIALKNKKRVIPAIIEKEVLKSFLPPILREPWIDFTDYDDDAKYSNCLKKLVRVIKKQKLTTESPKIVISQHNKDRSSLALLVIALMLVFGGVGWQARVLFRQVNTEKREAIITARQAQDRELQAQAQAAEALARENAAKAATEKALKEAKDTKTNLSIVIAQEKVAREQAADALAREQKALKEAKDTKTNLSIVIAREKVAKKQAADALAREQKALKGETDAKTNLSIVIAREKATKAATEKAQAQYEQAISQLEQTNEELGQANDKYLQAQIDLKEAINRANKAEETLRKYEVRYQLFSP